MTPTPAGGLPCHIEPPPRSTSQDAHGHQRPYQVHFTDEETEAQKSSWDQEEEKGGRNPRTADAPPGDSLADPWWPSPSSVLNRASAEPGCGRQERDRPALRPPRRGMPWPRPRLF